MNNMSRFFKILSVLLGMACLSGCAKDSAGDGDSDQLISFAPATEMTSTKTCDIEGIIQDAVFPEDRTFAMNAFRLNFDQYGNPIVDGGYLFMNMETVKYSDTDGSWHTDAHHYWPLSGGLYCLGFYPSPITLISHKMLGGITADHTGNLLFNGITIKHTDGSDNPIENDESKTDANLGHARVDLMTSTTTVDNVQTRASNSVPVEFSHALAQLRFSIETDKDYSSHTYYEKVGDVIWSWTHWQQLWIDQIKLVNVHSKGTFSHSAPHWPSDSLSNLYTYYPLRRGSKGGTQALYKVGTEGTPRDVLADSTYFGRRIPVQTSVSVDGTDPLCILLIPQRFPDDAEVEIAITSRIVNMLTSQNAVENPRYMNDHTMSMTKSFRLKEFLPYLTPGTSVNVRFVVALDDISIEIDYEDWTDSTSSELVM